MHSPEILPAGLHGEKDFLLRYVKREYPILLQIVNHILRTGANEQSIEPWRPHITSDTNLRAGIIEIIQDAERSDNATTRDNATVLRAAILKPYFPTPS